jgi:ERCC4-type nuclease
MFNVTIDSREQIPWSFPYKEVGSVIVRKLDTGDYSVEGLEDVLCIERKKSVSEIAVNILEARFEKELQRMVNYKYRFILCEFDYYHIDLYPVGSEIPKYKQKFIKIKGGFIRSKLVEYSIKYGIHIVLCGSAEYANDYAMTIMKRVKETQEKFN